MGCGGEREKRLRWKRTYWRKRHIIIGIIYESEEIKMKKSTRKDNSVQESEGDERRTKDESKRRTKIRSHSPVAATF